MLCRVESRPRDRRASSATPDTTRSALPIFYDNFPPSALSQIPAALTPFCTDMNFCVCCALLLPSHALPSGLRGFLPVGKPAPAKFPFPCLACGSVHAAGTFAQPFRKEAHARTGSPSDWQRLCPACSRTHRVQCLWATVRRHVCASQILHVLRRSLLYAHARACERMYSPGGVGYVRARDEFECARLSIVSDARCGA